MRDLGRGRTALVGLAATLRRSAGGPRAPALVLLGVVLALHREVVFGGGVYYYRDLHLQWQPQVEAFVESLTSGSWPTWNPLRSFGQPLLANPNAQVLYPPTWLTLVMPAWTYCTLYVIAHSVFSGLGLYRLGRRLELSRPASLLTAVSWVAGGPFLSLVNLWNHFAGAAWPAWAVLAVDTAIASGRTTSAFIAGAALAMPVLAGSPEMALMAAAAGAAVGIRQVGLRDVASLLRMGRALALSSAFALGIGAVQSIPALTLAAGSLRSDLPAEQRAFWSMPPAALAQSVYPLFLDMLPIRREVRASLYDSREPYLPSLYLRF